jgi:protein-disulfide isomerase/uncharacterized membrane protein
MLNRVVFLLSLLGMVLALHLWIQKERNFDQGCWGFGRTATASSIWEGCRAPKLQQAGSLLGVSSAAWGYAFYFAMAALAFGKCVLPAALAQRCHATAEVAVAVAFPYSTYLVYFQAFVAKAFCPLCLVSAALVTALFVIHAVQYVRGRFVPILESQRMAEVGYAAGMTFLAMGGLVALLLFVDKIGTRASGPATGQVAPVQPPLKPQEWIVADTPALGAAHGVSVVAFFDPNCPHCAGSYTTMTKLAERYKDGATIYVFPRVLWDYSMLQVQALELAKQNNKYFEMWKLQFEKRKKGGMNLQDIETLFRELGLDTRDLEKRLAATRPAVLAQRDKAKAAGVNSTPTIFVEGAPVIGPARSEENMGKLIEQAIAARKAPPPKTAAPTPPADAIIDNVEGE